MIVHQTKQLIPKDSVIYADNKQFTRKIGKLSQVKHEFSSKTPTFLSTLEDSQSHKFIEKNQKFLILGKKEKKNYYKLVRFLIFSFIW